MKKYFGCGVLLAALMLPICAVMAAPNSPYSVRQVVVLTVPPVWEMPLLNAREKRPWLNPARAALKV